MTNSHSNRGLPVARVPDRVEHLQQEGRRIPTVDSAAQFMGRAGVEIVNPLKVVSRGKDWMQAWDQIWKW